MTAGLDAAAARAAPTQDLARRLVSEGFGTAMLLAIVIGSGIMAERLTENLALALLANAVATGAGLVVLISMLGPVSGAHLNPAVTLVFALRGEIGMATAAGYAAAQVAGAILGCWTAHLMFAEAVLQVSTKLRDGPAQLFSEGVATFGLVLAILGVSRHRPDAVASAVGLYIVSAYWFTASTSFANPAVTLARAFTDSFSGIAPSSAPGFIVAQFGAAALAAAFAGWLFRPRSPQ